METLSQAERRERLLQEIRSNIERHGWHIYNVLGGESPRYAYTVGLKEKFGGELVLAGLCTLSSSAAANLLNRAAELLVEQNPRDIVLSTEGFGEFRLLETHPSWNKSMLFGCYDYYQIDELTAWQILPSWEEVRTVDVPDMSRPRSAEREPVWQWLDGGWPYSVPSQTTVVTNLDALLGYAITELMRWEDTEWEMFSGPGPDVPKEEMHVVPLATLLAFDPGLLPALDVPVETGLFREYDENGPGPWQPWYKG